MQKRKTIFLTIIVISISVIINDIIVFIFTKNSLEKKTEEFLNSQVKSVVSIVDLHRSEAIKKISYDINVAHDFFYTKYKLRETNKIITLNAIDQITKKEKLVSIRKWLLNGKQLQYNYDFVDKLKNMIGGTVTIFQKIEDGFLRISTNVLTKTSSRAVGTYIPNDSPVIKKILSGQRFYGRAYVVNQWYLTVYEPIWIKGEIKGMLYIGVREKDFQNLHIALSSAKIRETGYIAVIDTNGTAIVHPTSEGKDLSHLEIVKKIKKQKNGIFYYDYLDKKKVAAVSFYKPFGWYIVITITRNELVADFLSTHQIFTILFSVFLSITLVFLITKIIKRNEAFLRTLIETIPIPIFYKNKNMIYQGCNHEFEKFIQKKKKDILGKHIYSITDKNKAFTLNSIDEDLLRNPSKHSHEIELKSDKDSDSKHAIINSTVFFNKHEIDGIIGVITDITELKNYQEYLKKAHQTIATQKETLLKKNIDLENAIQTKNKFFSIIAHDLRNPFTGLINLSYILNDEETSEKEKQIVVNELINSVESTYNLLTNLLEWANSQLGLQKINYEKFDLYSLIYNKALKYISLLAKEKEITIKSEVSKPLKIKADKNMVEAIIRNLLVNALKFTNKKGEIKIIAREKDEKIEITIKDNGIGMNKEKVKSLFDQGSIKSTKGTNNEKGTGLGLLLCKEFIDKHKGTIHVDSKIVKGTFFTVTLPK